ncbi:aryl hydrocarbon receptor-like isoform X3 [Lethenteron reissneri]|nr:aryl hydrocarbon receptor-like isoform X3 [Lethenteron reissneri]XP_061412063.1 aryl hydrocarbon receptor-like isoform X3 [Lethenteron reissneri]XP_061412064.1 aryl hydrocarbon receptor-like isoform X3 [Lethenteron reissneri]
MSSTLGISLYASRKRKKPVQRRNSVPEHDASTWSEPLDIMPNTCPKMEGGPAVKTNPSKRHRDRLNSEMERLAGMLPFPQDVVAKLDKLSILRLSVSYLRAKTYFNVTTNRSQNQLTNGKQMYGGSMGPGPPGIQPDLDTPIAEGEHLLQALNGFVLVVTAEGLVFYVSHTIQEYLGFHQCDVVHQSVYELVHSEDRYEFLRQLHWALKPPPAARDAHKDGSGDQDGSTSSVAVYNPQQLPPENSSFLERQFICRFRCLLDNSSGFLALQMQGRLKFLHGQNRRSADGSLQPAQLALFAVATPLQSPSILEIRTRNIIFRTKHKLDFTPIGCDAKGRIVLGYTELELAMRGTGYQFIHAADMLHCADNHVRMMKTGESGITIFRLLTKGNRWAWVQANARLVYKNGRPDYIIATQRPLSNEEGEEHLRKRALQFPFAFTTGEAMLYETGFLPPEMQGNLPPKDENHLLIKRMSSGKNSEWDKKVDPSSLLGAMMQQDQTVYVRPPATESRFATDLAGGLSMPSLVAESSHSVGQASGWNGGKGSLLSYVKIESDVEKSLSEPSSLDSGFQVPDELNDILETLGLTIDDIELLEEEEKQLMMDVDCTPDLESILSNDDILSLVQESLNKNKYLRVQQPQMRHGSSNDSNMQTFENYLQPSQTFNGRLQSHLPTQKMRPYGQFGAMPADGIEQKFKVPCNMQGSISTSGTQPTSIQNVSLQNTPFVSSVQNAQNGPLQCATHNTVFQSGMSQNIVQATTRKSNMPGQLSNLQPQDFKGQPWGTMHAQSQDFANTMQGHFVMNGSEGQNVAATQSYRDRFPGQSITYNDTIKYGVLSQNLVNGVLPQNQMGGVTVQSPVSAMQVESPLNSLPVQSALNTIHGQMQMSSPVVQSQIDAVPTHDSALENILSKNCMQTSLVGAQPQGTCDWPRKTRPQNMHLQPMEFPGGHTANFNGTVGHREFSAPQQTCSTGVAVPLQQSSFPGQSQHFMGYSTDSSQLGNARNQQVNSHEYNNDQQHHPLQHQGQYNEEKRMAPCNFQMQSSCPPANQQRLTAEEMAAIYCTQGSVLLPAGGVGTANAASLAPADGAQPYPEISQTEYYG